MCYNGIMLPTPDTIIKKAQKLLKKGGDRANALVAMGMAYVEKGILDKGIFYYKKAIAEDSAQAPAFAGLGLAYGRKGYVEESIIHLQEAIRLAPSCALLYNWLGDAFFDSNRIPEAISSYRQATALDALDSNAHNDLADALRFQGDYLQALNFYEKTLLIDPGDTNAMLEKAQVLIHLHQREQAHTELLKLVEHFPESNDAQTAKIILGALYSQDGNFAAAGEFLRQAAQHFPFNPAIQFQLGLCCLILNNHEPAKEHLQQALDLDPDNVRVVRLLQQIRKAERSGNETAAN